MNKNRTVALSKDQTSQIVVELRSLGVSDKEIKSELSACHNGFKEGKIEMVFTEGTPDIFFAALTRMGL
jgi:hypothetical protein